MKILGIGIDIIDNKRIKESIKNNKFKSRIYSSNELKLSKKTKNKVAFFSKRFAAKEAFSKALGTGFSKDYSWSTIGYFSPTVSYGTSRPQVRLKQKLEGKIIHLSVSDEKRYVIAYVTIEETKNEQRSKLR